MKYRNALCVLACVGFVCTSTSLHAQTIRVVDNVTPIASPNESWSDSNYAFTIDALRAQASAVAGFYRKRAVYVLDINQTAPRGAWTLAFENQCIVDGRSYAAFHTIRANKPYACVAAIGGNGFYWMTRGAEHELAEMLANPRLTGREIVDPVASRFVTLPNGEPFVDFLLPRHVVRRTKMLDYFTFVGE
jgi:hypothetical protein